jgi:hypothetical protein
VHFRDENGFEKTHRLFGKDNIIVPTHMFHSRGYIEVGAVDAAENAIMNMHDSMSFNTTIPKAQAERPLMNMVTCFSYMLACGFLARGGFIGRVFTPQRANKKIKKLSGTQPVAMFQFPQQSVRSDDGGARYSVKALIAELESGMRSKGGNHRNITGMDLAIVRTLLTHINKLEDRIDELEGKIPSIRDITSELDRKQSNKPVEDAVL